MAVRYLLRYLLFVTVYVAVISLIMRVILQIVYVLISYILHKVLKKTEKYSLRRTFKRSWFICLILGIFIAIIIYKGQDSNNEIEEWQYDNTEDQFCEDNGWEVDIVDCVFHSDDHLYRTSCWLTTFRNWTCKKWSGDIVFVDDLEVCMDNGWVALSNASWHMCVFWDENYSEKTFCYFDDLLRWTCKKWLGDVVYGDNDINICFGKYINCLSDSSLDYFELSLDYLDESKVCNNPCPELVSDSELECLMKQEKCLINLRDFRYFDECQACR